MSGAGQEAAGGECPRCQGTGFAHEQKGGREYARRCRCRAGAGVPRDRDPLATLGIPFRHRHCTLGNFEPRTPALSAAYDRALAYSNRFQEARAAGLGLVFWGPSGTGKTHLAVAVLRELAETHGVRGQFWDYHELMREIRNSYNPATALTEYELLEPIIELEVLLLDDLGAWKMTDWMNDTLFYILNRRYLARRPTLITTNYPDRDVSPRDLEKAAPTVRREYLVDRIGYRLRSRLLEACTVVRLDGPDRRQVALQASNQRLLL